MTDGNLRSTGIDVLGEVPWGTHFCQFFHSREDLVDILVPYFKAGLADNEFCMWVTAEPLEIEDARKALAQAVPDLESREQQGQIEIISYRDWYLKNGSFDSQRVLQGWVDKLEGALARGYDGLRLTGNTFWLEKMGWNDFLAYEEAVNSVIGNYRMIALCTYSIDRCVASEIIDVVNTHQFALIKREGQWVLIESSERKRAAEEIQRLNHQLSRAVDELRGKSASLEQANSKLKELDRLKSMFIASMSHELRTPLNSIIGFTGVLLQELPGSINDEQRRQLGIVKESAHQLLALINDVIDISKIEANKAEVSPAPFDLVGLAREVAAAFAQVADGKGVLLSVTGAETAQVDSDRRRVRQVLTNLIGNALKATDRGGVEVAVSRSDAGLTAVAVRDTGTGIRAEDLGKLFSPFSQIVPGDRAREGSGLGLYLSRKIADLLGADIRVESEFGRGSVFTLSLPRTRPKSEAGRDVGLKRND